MRSLKQLVILSLLVLSSGCGTFKVSDWQASVTLPASGDCMSFNIVSGKETRLPADSKECIDKKRRSVWIDSENYLILRKDILKNCQYARCKEITGAFDSIFLSLDSAILNTP